MIYLMCHQSSVCSSAFSLKRFIHHSTAPLSVVVCSSVRHFSAGARFSHLIGFYHHFRCEVTGVPGVISEGGLNARRQLSRGRGSGWGCEGEGGGCQLHLCPFVLLCGTISSLKSLSIFPTLPLLLYSVLYLCLLLLGFCCV